MASIKKRKHKDGTYVWQATIYVGRDANGKQLFEYVTKDSEKECKRVARQIEQELDEGTFLNVENIRVTAWIEKWMELNKGRLSPSTFATYRTYQRNHFDPFFDRYKLKQLNEIIIKQFMLELSKKTGRNKEKKMSQASIRRVISALKGILWDALKHKSPVKDIKLPKEEKYTPRVPTDSEMAKIHDAIRGTRDEPIVLLAAWCGLRRGEIFALKWDDMDWTRGRLRVDESYCINEDCEYEDKPPKSENGYREVVVPEYLMSLLDDLRKPRGRKKRRKKIPENVVELDGGKAKKADYRIFKMRPDSYSSYWAEFVREKGLPQIRFHDLRHYHASWLYAKGVPDQYAAQRLGHDIKILKGIYQHLGLDRQMEIDDNIRQMFAPKKDQTEAEDTGK